MTVYSLQVKQNNSCCRTQLITVLGLLVFNVTFSILQLYVDDGSVLTVKITAESTQKKKTFNIPDNKLQTYHIK